MSAIAWWGYEAAYIRSNLSTKDSRLRDRVWLILFFFPRLFHQWWAGSVLLFLPFDLFITLSFVLGCAN